MNCPSCGAAVQEGARYCSNCGHELASRGDERRVVTVVFGDLVGFTGIAETLDPEQVKLLVERCFEVLVSDITSFGGRVDKIIGDAIVALFGAPLAHEDDPERAVRAALRMQQTLAHKADELGVPVQMRIGVNTGEVLVGSLRAGGDYTAMGDVVNTASRLQTMAEPGQVVVGAATHAATAEAIAYQPIGALSVRGRGDPVEAWVAVTALVPPGHRRGRMRSPLVGRDSEMRLAGHAIEAAVERSRAVSLTLVGEAGVGKSRLAGELVTLAESRHGALVLEGRCLPYGEANIWWPIAQALRGACLISSDDPPSQIRQKVFECIATTLERSTDDADVTRIGFGLLHLMGLDSPLRGIEPQRAREEVNRAILDYLDAHLRTRPVMLVLADIHWAAAPVLDLLANLMARLVERPFIVLVTARSPFRESPAPAGSGYNTLAINLDPLGRDATAQLLDNLFEGRVPPVLRDELLDRSGGNPLFLEELVALVDTGAAVGSAAAGAPHGAEALARHLPSTLRGLVAARLDRLTLAERRVVEDAAVFGRSGPVLALVLMAAADRAGHGSRGEDEVDRAIEGLVEKEILLLDENGTSYAFRSGLVRDVAYSMLTKAARAQRHYGIGEFLEANFATTEELSTTFADTLAHHYGQAAEQARDLGAVEGVPPDIVERALKWLQIAAFRADANDLHLVSEPLFTRILDLLEATPTPERTEALLARARARGELRRLAEARGDVEAAIASSDVLEDRLSRARGLLIEGTISEKEGDLEAAVAAFGEAEEAFRELGERHWMAEALRLRGMAELFRGDATAAHAAISAALDTFGALGDRRGEAWALQNLAWLSYQEGRPAEADRRIARSAEMFNEIGDGGGLGWALGLLAWVRFHQGEWSEAESIGTTILDDARGRGDSWAEGMMLMLSASIRLWTGRATAAIDLAQEAIEAFRVSGDVDREAQAASLLGRAFIATGSIGEGFRTIDLAIERGRALPGGSFSGPTTAATAAVAIGDPERALRAVALVGVDDLDPSVVSESERLIALGLALLQMAQLDEALVHLRTAVNPRVEEAPSGYALSALACANAVAGEEDEVERLAAEVLRISRSTYLDRITALLAVGSMRAGLGDEASAEAAFADALDLADESDDRVAQLLVRLVWTEVAALCGRPPGPLGAEAAARRAELGIDASGWTRVFGSVAQRFGCGASRT